jgi:rare lipoprotein A
MRIAIFTLVAFSALAACATDRARAQHRQTGLASWVSDSLAGQPTASGEAYDPAQATCAHKTLPFGQVVHIRVPATGRTSTCVVNDRGPFVRGRVIDVSRAVAEDLGMIKAGLLQVEIISYP